MLVYVWRCITTICMWLTDSGSFWIISTQIGHSTGIAGIIKDLWNLKSILVTNLSWVTRSPSVSRWRVSFCFTFKSYALLYTNNILRLKSTNLGWSCRSSWKIKNQIKKQLLPKDISEWLNCLHQLLGPQPYQYTYMQEGILYQV